MDEDDDNREHSRPRIRGVTQDKACHAVPCCAAEVKADRPDRAAIAALSLGARRETPAAAPAHSGRLVRGEFLPIWNETMRTASDSASMLLMTSCFDGLKVSCNEQRAAAEAPPWEGCVHPITSRPHETISSAWGMHGN